jgi:acetylornithine/succinyldiaminopimelate/putrescine aminotransferase
LFAYEQFDVEPDMVTLAKPLAGGLPMAAVLMTEQIAQSIKPGDHGTTFGGSPVPAAAALEHLTLRDELNLDAHVETVGSALRGELVSIAQQWPAVFGLPRGHGLLLGLPVRDPHKAADFATRALDFGLIINAAGRNTLRFVPPLIINRDDIRAASQRLRATIAATIGS